MQRLYRASHKPGEMQSAHFIHLTLRLFSRNTTVRTQT